MNKKLTKLLFLLHFGGATYVTIEIFYRQKSYPEMYLLGGLVFLICGMLNEGYRWETPLGLQVVIGGLIATAMEWLGGMYWNVCLGKDMWNYMDVWGHDPYGQICIPFALIWLVIVLVAIIVDDWLRWKCLGEETPRYYVGNKVIDFGEIFK